MQKIQNFINGSLVPPEGVAYLNNTNPATGQVYSLIPDSDHRDIELAINAADAAFPVWANTPVAERADILLNFAKLILENLDALAEAESVDNGKPVALAKSVDIPRAADNFKFFAHAIVNFSSEAHPTETRAINYTLRTPLGVVACISPWNLPLYLFTWKIAPALAAGNCVVGKPSEVTPMTAFLLSELAQQAGIPKGVLNIVHGTGPKIGSALTCHEKISAISFTGGTLTGAEIARTAAPLFKKLSLELGGKNPNIIFADCNYDEMLATTLRSSFSNQGQICLCGSRIFIEKSLYSKFKNDFVEAANKLVVGDPQSENSNLGAIVSEAHLHKIQSYIQLAREEGGTILTGGNRVNLDGQCKDGWFMEPTVIDGLPPSCRTNQEEIFGPVVTLIPFENEKEVLKQANSTKYGLSATIWTENLTRAHRMANKIQAGIIWVNCWMLRDLRTPFGGTKSSGVGREGGLEALRFFTEPKNVCVKL